MGLHGKNAAWEVITQSEYIFRDCGREDTLLFETLQSACAAHNLQLKFSYEQYKTGTFFSRKKNILLIQNGTPVYAALATAVSGDLLTVILYLLSRPTAVTAEDPMSVTSGWHKLSASAANLLELSTWQSFWRCLLVCLEEAFYDLDMVEWESGFQQ